MSQPPALLRIAQVLSRSAQTCTCRKPHDNRVFLEQAQAILRAIETPTDEMMAAGDACVIAHQTWRAMIRAAVDEQIDWHGSNTAGPGILPN
jgi:hypothetical protein